MTIGWQEIIAIGIVVLACFIVFRRLLWKGSRSEPGCGGTCSARPTSPDRGVQIKEVHQIEISRQLPSGKDEV